MGTVDSDFSSDVVVGDLVATVCTPTCVQSCSCDGPSAVPVVPAAVKNGVCAGGGGAGAAGGASSPAG